MELPFEQLVPEWYWQFLTQTVGNNLTKLTDMLRCATFLEIPALQRLCAGYLASKLRYYSTSLWSLRNFLSIDTDYTPQEEKLFAEGLIGIWDTFSEDIERKNLEKVLHER
jgi:hypothetical protein